MNNKWKLIEISNIGCMKQGIFHIPCTKVAYESAYFLNLYTHKEFFPAVYAARCMYCKKYMPESMKIMRNLINGE